MKAKNIDMTEGVPWKQMLLFAGPVFLGNLFQQLYNVVDSVIVGNFLGSNALAAVSSSGNLLNMVIGFFNGVALGAGIVIARYFGAKDEEKLSLAIHTDVAFGLIFGFVLSILGVLLSPWMLRMMNTPEEMMPNSLLYFRVYFSGMLMTAMYNVFVGIMQSTGDSTHPLYYLMISSLINIFLDLLLIGFFGYGVGAAAFATVFSQGVSAFLCFRRLLLDKSACGIRIREIRIDGGMLRQIVTYGLPSGIQASITSFANVIMQADVNLFGVDAIAGCGAYSKIDGFGFLPIMSISNSMATYVGQNLGAKKYDRVQEGIRFGLFGGIILSEALGGLIFAFSPQLIMMFDRTPEVVAYGVQRARTQELFHYALAATHYMAGILRGAGKTRVTMFTFIISWCIIRVLFVSVLLPFVFDIAVVNWAYPLTWNISMVILIVYMRKTDWMHGFDQTDEKQIAA